MPVVNFTGDQMMVILEWLENQADAGYTINDVIESIKDGSATTSVISTDRRVTH